MTYKDQHDTVRREFKKQAQEWLKRQDNLADFAAGLEFSAEDRVLDVSTGTAIFARAVAPHIEYAFGCDISYHMLEQAQAFGVPNLHVNVSAAEYLPYPDSSFDAVISRYALHHWLEPGAVLAEMYRVCRAGGRIILTDIVAPEEPELAEPYNQIERLRDPSHTNAVSFTQLQTLIQAAGFEVAATDVNQGSEMDVEAWFNLANTPEDVRQQVLARFEAELNGGTKTGLFPYMRDGKLKTRTDVATVIGMKPE